MREGSADDACAAARDACVYHHVQILAAHLDSKHNTTEDDSESLARDLDRPRRSLAPSRSCLEHRGGQHTVPEIAGHRAAPRAKKWVL